MMYHFKAKDEKPHYVVLYANRTKAKEFTNKRTALRFYKEVCRGQ